MSDIRPPWVERDAEPPDLGSYVESELAVAGALSTLAPFAVFHPAWALPFARAALEALGRWEPTDAQEVVDAPHSIGPPADNPHFVNLGEVGEAPAEIISFPLDESLFIHRREVWVGRPGNPESRIVGDIKPDPGHEVAVIVVWRTEDGEVAGGEPADA